MPVAVDINVALGGGIAFSATGAGVWFILRIVIHYQGDFTDRAMRRVGQLEDENEGLRRRLRNSEDHNTVLEHALTQVEAHRAACIRDLTDAGLPVPPPPPEIGYRP